MPDADGNSDSDATVDYREDSLLALAAGDEDVLIRLSKTFKVDPSLVPLDGDGFASWLTKQDQVKAGTVTPAMQQKYAKEIRAAKLEEFKSYLDNDAARLTDRRKLGRDVNFLTGRWVLTVKVLFQVQGALGLSRFPRQVCLGPADRPLLGTVSVWLRSVPPITIGTFFTSISRPPFFRGNTRICHPDRLLFSCPRTSACHLGWSVFAFVRSMV